jgi:sugar phosphate isomerase/epimerase
MDISIASYSFHGLIARGEMDVFGYLESVRFRYHLRAADIWNGLLGKDPDRYLDREFLGKVKRAMDERGLYLANYHADGCHIWEDDAAARERNRALAERHIEAAELLGARTVRIDAGGKGHVWSVEQFDTIVERYRTWAKRAAEGGYRIGPETHWGPELVADNMERLAKAVDSPAYGILLHVGHWEQSDPEQSDRRLARYACHTHIDAKITATRLEPAIRMLAESGYTGCLGVEHHSGQNEFEEVEYQLAAVRRALAHIRNESPADRVNPLLGF